LLVRVLLETFLAFVVYMHASYLISFLLSFSRCVCY